MLCVLKLNKEEINELLSFAIEGRKRVKDQLMRIDSTFNQVDFHYICKHTNQKINVQTLEEIEYPNHYYHHTNNEEKTIEKNIFQKNRLSKQFELSYIRLEN